MVTVELWGLCDDNSRIWELCDGNNYVWEVKAHKEVTSDLREIYSIMDFDTPSFPSYRAIMCRPELVDLVD